MAESNANGNGKKAIIRAIAIGAAAFVEQSLSELLGYWVRKARAYNERRKTLKNTPDKAIQEKKP
jgi:hypothetical protein